MKSKWNLWNAEIPRNPQRKLHRTFEGDFTGGKLSEIQIEKWNRFPHEEDPILA